MKRLKTTLSLLLASLMLAGCGGVAMQQVDAGNYVVEMPGEVNKTTQSIPIEIEEINLSSSFTLTTTETVDYTEGATYTAVDGRLGPAGAGLQNGVGGCRAYL